MNIEGKDLMPFIDDAIPEMQLQVREDFEHGRIDVVISFSRYFAVSITKENLESETKLIDDLSRAAQQGCKILRNEIRKTVA